MDVEEIINMAAEMMEKNPENMIKYVKALKSYKINDEKALNETSDNRITSECGLPDVLLKHIRKVLVRV